MAVQTVNELWEEYLRETQPSNLSTILRWELRRAFFSGASSMLNAITDSARESGTGARLSIGSDVLLKWHQELLRFMQDVSEGRA